VSKPRGLLIALMMGEENTSKTLLNFYQTTIRNNPEDSHLNMPIGNKNYIFISGHE
jgi:hypothetical protein